MRLYWKLLLAISLWNAVNGPSINVEASIDVYSKINQFERNRNERFSKRVAKTSKLSPQRSSRNISIVGDEFMLDGKPLRIVSGTLHYFRVPAAYWRDRLRKFKAAGLNTVSSYVEWSFHEPEERQYSFEGDRDVAQFIRTAAEEGLHVLLRVGPYICAERDLGGFPYWLLGKYPNIKLRTTDKNYIEESQIWINKLFEQVSPLLYGNGGPIILVQVENEYGSTGYNDMAYKEKARDMLLQHVGTNALLYTTDGSPSSYFTPGSVPNTLTTIDFGAGGSAADVNSTFEELRKFMPHGPLMNSEFYTGWLTHWGEHFSTESAEVLVDTLGFILDYGANVNLYVFSGGSNFEFTSGANYDNNYTPVITSYDFDAPLTEAGDPTPKYFLIRDKLKQYNLVDASIEPPTPSAKGAYGPVRVNLTVNLLSPEGRSQLGKKYSDVTGATLPTFEALRQRGGLMLYETKLSEANGSLCILKPRDMVFVYVDGVYKGRINRMLQKYCLPLSSKNDSLLSLLVEEQGRINYGDQIHDFKGILSPVQYNNRSLDGKWSITGYPLNSMEISAPETKQSIVCGPKLYDTYFTIPADKEPLDTFIDTTDWGKGYIWVNGHNLGRYWPSVGPQITLYVPGVWLKKAPAQNYLQILELDKPSQNLVMTFIDHPILNRTGNIN